MPGPSLDPVKTKQFVKGFTGQEPQPSQSPQGLASALAQAYAAKANGQPSPAPQGPSPQAAPSAPAMNPHTMAMQEAAEAAKQKYMLENGVDENGDPVQK